MDRYYRPMDFPSRLRCDPVCALRANGNPVELDIIFEVKGNIS